MRIKPWKYSSRKPRILMLAMNNQRDLLAQSPENTGISSRTLLKSLRVINAMLIGVKRLTRIRWEWRKTREGFSSDKVDSYRRYRLFSHLVNLCCARIWPQYCQTFALSQEKQKS